MENPLGDMPSLDPNNEPPKEETPTPEVASEQPPVEEAPAESTDEAAAEEPKAKKPFFTMGKIMAIFGVLLIVGTVVGAIIYSQSSDRFQGDIVSYRTTAPIDSGLTAVTTDVKSISDLNIVDKTETVAPKCDSALNRTPSSTDDVFNCICEDGFVSLNATDTCITLDYCAITEVELADYFASIYVSTTTETQITTVLGGSLPKYQEKNCKEDEPLTTITTLREPVTMLTVPEEKVLTCEAPLVKQMDSASGTEYCMCPSQTYPFITLSTTDLRVAGTTSQTQCLPFKCDFTTEEASKIQTDILSILNAQNLDTKILSSITASFSASLKSWTDKNCQPEIIVEVTCDDLKEDLGAAYFAANWDQYNTVLKQLQEKKCLDSCEIIFYRVVLHLSQNQTAEARKLIDSYIQTCTDECTLTYGMMSLYAESLSNMPATLTAATVIPAEDLARLKELVIKYIEKCQCFEIEAFLTAPGFPENDYFVQGSATRLDTLDSSILERRDDTINYSTDALNDSIIEKKDNTINYSTSAFRTAYAQSLSPTVMGVIEDAYNDLCVPTDEPKSCTTLTITAPSSTGTYQMNADFNPASDYLKFNVDNDELITGYKITSQTVVFDGDSESITTDKMELSLDGGPAVGSEDIITVTALEAGEAGGAIVTHVTAPVLKETCSAELKVVRPPENPPTDDSDPVCRSLEIISPADAAEPGVPTFELSEGEYTNKVLEIDVDADSGSVHDYKYSSANGYITFNGDETLYTTDKTVVMEGVIPEGETETISVWARAVETLSGIQTCNDGYIVTVPEEEEPPPPEDPPPPTTVTEEEPPPPIEEIVVPSTPAPEPVVTTPAPAPVHAAAPAVAETGPGILIYLLGAGIGGTLLRKRKK